MVHRLVGLSLLVGSVAYASYDVQPTPGAAVPTATPAFTATPRATDTPAFTPTLVPTATPQPTATPAAGANTPTPQPTATPPVNISYAGSLNVAGATAISASATPKAGDRNIDCTSGSSSDATYTLPAATGSGRIIDVTKVDSGTKSCIIGRTGSDAINSGTTRTLSTQWFHDTCRDLASAQWLCVGNGV